MQGYPVIMPPRQTTEDKRLAAQRAPIVTKGMEMPALPRDALYTELKARIENGTFKPGEKFLSIAEVMTAGQVAKNTARSALLRLTEEGYLSTFSGYGAFTNPPEKWGTKTG